jgi:UDP-N-acetylglucosamine 2-epimerase
LAATPASAERITRMGEPRSRIHVVGSPGIDALASIDPLDDPAFEELGRPDALLLMHPVGRTSEAEEAAAAAVIEGLEGRRILALHPNYDAGREGILRALEHAAAEGRLRLASHLPRERFVGLLKRLASSGGVMAGNSSAALIEAAALGLPALDVGSRQNGRERCSNVVHVAGEYPADVAQALRQAATLDLSARVHPYGAGDAGIRIASLLASIDPSEPGFQRKRCAY